MERTTPTVEQSWTNTGPGELAVEITYEGTYRFEEQVLEDGKLLEEHFAPLGRWVASTLVRLADLKLEYLPPDEEEEP